MNSLRRQFPRYRQRMPVNPEHWVAMTLFVSVYVDPTDETLVETVTSTRGGSIERAVREEIQSNLESVSYVKQVLVSVQAEKEKPMTVKFFPNDKGSPAGKLADAELHFSGGPLDGLKLIGFAIWERRGGSRSVTFPARQYTVNGERRSFALLRPAVDTVAQERLRDVILDAYKDHESAMAEAI